ncbi:NlpC/P60 family protein [Compostibacter hankyongensis]|uniref:C40 family peptidase n=1 Tax=Compostibacter hankyongensis TaxID=1007089 RepID=A0ABP8FDR8_9BACT
MRKGVKTSLAIAGLFFGCGPVYAQTDDGRMSDAVRDIAAAVHQRFVPDDRTDIFRVWAEGEDSLQLLAESTLPRALAAFRSALDSAGIRTTVRNRLLPGSGTGKKTYGIVNLSVANNRKLPSNASEMVTQMLLGTPVRILKKEKGYYLVRTPDRYISWTDDAAVVPVDEAAYRAWVRAPKTVYTKEYGHAFAAPSDTAMRVSDLVQGDILEVLGTEKGFFRIRYPDGRIAYLPVREAMPYERWIARPDPDAAQIIGTAKTLTGVPYLWGGTSIKGMDCSGFTKTSFFLNGIILPRDASQQARVGVPVDILENDTLSLRKCLQNLRPGDLLFFTPAKDNRNGPPHITHTAIYMGDGVFIQAAGRVRINNMLPGTEGYDDFQSRRLVSARRILGATDSPGISRVEHNFFYTGQSSQK